VAIINAMPAFPLDGGHVFRAWLWYLTGDLVLATRIAALYASMVAIALVLAGAALLFGSASEPYWGFGLGVAGFQLHGSARRSLRRARWSIAGATLSLREAVPYPPRFPCNGTVAGAVDLLLTGLPESFLLITDGETPVGILRLADLRGTQRARWDQMTAGEVMTPFTALPRLPAELTVPEAMAQLAGRATAAIVQDGDRVLGVVTNHDLITVVNERANRVDEAGR
jgi:CBS domain-containing protein